MKAAAESLGARRRLQAAHATTPAPMPAATRIILSGVELADGERIYVCGDRPELGSWDPDRARPLTREGDAWSTSVEQGGGEFKFLRRSADGKVIWEGGENRELGTALQIETRWQS